MLAETLNRDRGSLSQVYDDLLMLELKTAECVITSRWVCTHAQFHLSCPAFFFHNYYCNDNGSHMTDTTSALHEYVVFLAPVHVFVRTSQPINVKFECTRGNI